MIDQAIDEGPWEVRWAWNTGYSGVDHFAKPERALIFCDELFKRVEPPAYDIASLSVINTETGERLPDLSGKPPRVQVERKPLAPGMKACGTCSGLGEIFVVKTGNRIDCTRCSGTGQEPA